MDEIQNLDTNKIAGITQRYRRNSRVDSVSSIFASIILIVTLIWKEPIAKYFSASDDMVMLVGCAPTGVFLFFACLSWRSRANDSLAFTNSMYEIQKHSRKIEAAVKKEVSSRK